MITGGGAGNRSVPGTRAAAESQHELARYDSGFLERHNPGSGLVNSLKVIGGVPGTLIVFDSGLGYVSSVQNPSLKPARLPFEKGGYLKFLVPAAAILGIHDVSVIRNRTGDANNTFIAEVDLDRNSPFFQSNQALMAESDQNNRLFFTFKDRFALQTFLQNASHGSAARDTF